MKIYILQRFHSAAHYYYFPECVVHPWNAEIFNAVKLKGSCFKQSHVVSLVSVNSIPQANHSARYHEYVCVSGDEICLYVCVYARIFWTYTHTLVEGIPTVTLYTCFHACACLRALCGNGSVYTWDIRYAYTHLRKYSVLFVRANQIVCVCVYLWRVNGTEQVVDMIFSIRVKSPTPSFWAIIMRGFPDTHAWLTALIRLLDGFIFQCQYIGAMCEDEIVSMLRNRVMAERIRLIQL